MSVTEVSPRRIGGRYTLGEIVAELATGQLLSALDHRQDAAVQIHRVLCPAGTADARTRARVVSQRLSALDHRNLPRVVELVEDEEAVYSVQEEVRGLPLPSLGVPVEPEIACRYLEQILGALAYMHVQQPPLIHRDLRPETVLVSPHGRVLLIGADVASVGVSAVSNVTSGNPEFAAPEQLQGAPAEPAADVYAAGALAHYLLTGKPPRSGPLKMGLHVPQELVALLQAMLQPDPAGRPTAAAALAILQSRPDAGGYRLPAFLNRSDSDVPEAQEFPTLPPTEPVKRSMWNLLFGTEPQKRKPRWSPDENSPLVQMAIERFPRVELEQMDLDIDIARLLPEIAARCIQGVCIGLTGNHEMIVAAKDPSLVYIYDHVLYATEGRYKAVVRAADATWIDRALEWTYRNRTPASWRTWIQRRALDAVPLEVSNPMADVSGGGGEEMSHPILEATDRMIKEALSVGTSDIHMETFENRVDVRYRIDGVLQPVASYTLAQGNAMIKRLKVMANMDIASERVTQGGRISLKIGEKKYDLRVSIVPVAYGESVVMRVLKKGSFNLTLADLGMEPNLERRYRAALSQPHGIILVCGPTGSGKSTTLYASLKELMRPDRKILTVEDPVEYGMDGLVQVQVNLAPRDDEQKVTFAKVLKEFLRQDPEVILVGEIRDPETGSIALQASLTGHLVLSTLHTNDSVGLVSRLRDMGIKSYLVGSTLRCGLSQRLARRICAGCREEIEVTADVIAEMERECVPKPYRSFRGRGCKECLQTGYRGRVGIYELLEVTNAVRSLISREATDEELLAQLRKEGFRSLLQSALEMVNAGQISYEEVQRVCESG